MKLSGLLSSLFASAFSLPAGPSKDDFNATQMLVDAHIDPLQLTLSRRRPSYIGERLGGQWDFISSTYGKIKSGFELSQTERREFGTARKLLQLAEMVKQVQRTDYLFERYCFYGCHCIPGYAVHDSTAGKGPAQDGIDSVCSRLKQCYWCANDEEDGQCDGTMKSYSWTTVDNDNDGKVDDIVCFNSPGTCRWKLCQCDRQFALQLRDVEETYNPLLSEENSFDRQATCSVPSTGRETGKKCCGNYANNFRLIFNPNRQECCSEEYSDVKEIGTCE